MREQKELPQRKSPGAFTLRGLIGCGAGALVGGLIGAVIQLIMAPRMVDPSEGLQGVVLLAFLMMGAGGGISLGRGLKLRKMPVIALISAIGFGTALLLGFLVPALIPINRMDGINDFTNNPYAVLALRSGITGAIFGVVGGALMGLKLRGGAGAKFLTLPGLLAGIVIFAVLFITIHKMSEMNIRYSNSLLLITVGGMTLAGIVMGAALGLGLGRLEKSTADRQRTD